MRARGARSPGRPPTRRRARPVPRCATFFPSARQAGSGPGRRRECHRSPAWLQHHPQLTPQSTDKRQHPPTAKESRPLYGPALRPAPGNRRGLRASRKRPPCRPTRHSPASPPTSTSSPPNSVGAFVASSPPERRPRGSPRSPCRGPRHRVPPGGGHVRSTAAPRHRRSSCVRWPRIASIRRTLTPSGSGCPAGPTCPGGPGGKPSASRRPTRGSPGLPGRRPRRACARRHRRRRW